MSTINPGFHRTEINHNAADTLRVAFEKAPKEVQADYGEDYLQVCKRAKKRGSCLVGDRFPRGLFGMYWIK